MKYMKTYKMVSLGELITPSKIVKCGDGEYPVLSMTMHNGLVFQDDKFKKEIASNDKSNYKVVYRNQLVISFPIDEGVLAAQRIVDAGIVSPAYAIWNIDQEKILPEYLEMSLRCERALQYYKANLRGSTARRRSLPTPTLLAFEVPLPSIEEQNKVLEIMHTAEKMIDAYNKELEQYDLLVKARFVELFGMPGTDTKGWELYSLGSVCYINPKKSQDHRLGNGVMVSFVPMSAVTESGEIDPSLTKKYDEVKTGFTYFAEGDVLFAKITPCMENGKGAVAKGLCNGIGFGSTEFHVLRPINGRTNSYWIYTLTSFPQFRTDAASNMIGSAGQRRVPATFLENYRVSVPPIELQNQFADFVAQVDKSKVAVQKALDETQLLFDSLMQEYFG
jgi:type I restriction enzyme S subunit